MEDGRHWCLQRLYQDFYDLQINLIQEFPLEAGNIKGHERSLPYMPGPVTYVTDKISNGRRANLDEYIRNLLKLGPHITKGYLVRKFFAPRQGDYEIDPEAADSYRLSSGSQDSPAGVSSSISPQSSAGNLGQSGAPASSAQRATPATATAASGGGSSAPSGPGHYRNASSITSGPTASIAGGPPGAGVPGAVKIKVWFEPDNCVVIRMPATFQYADLYAKLQERRELEGLPSPAAASPDGSAATELEVAYRDEVEGKLFAIRDDEDLRVARERNLRLMLSVRIVSAQSQAPR